MKRGLRRIPLLGCGSSRSIRSTRLTEAACLSLLDERERLRHARFLDPRAARGFVLGRGLLRA